MKIAICRKGINKFKDFKALANSFENLELTQAQLASEINNGFAFTTQHDGHRAQENFTCAQHIALDFDDAAPKDYESIKNKEGEFTRSYCGIFYTTPSHTPEKPKFRLVFELEHPIHDADYYRDAVQALIWIYQDEGATADKSCTDPCRFFYGSKGSEPEFTNKLLPMNELARIIKAWKATQQKPAPQPERRASQQPSDEYKRKRIEAVLEAACDELRSAAKHTRHDTLIRKSRLLGGYLQGEPGILSEYDVTSALESAYSVHDELNPYEMKSTIKAGIEHGRRDPLYVDMLSAKSTNTTPAQRSTSTTNEPAQRQDVDQETGEIKSYNPTDLGNAERLVAQFGNELKFVSQWGWLVWNGKQWEMDEYGQAKQLAKRTVRTIYQEAAQIEDLNQRTKIAKWAMTSESAGKIEAMLNLAEDEASIRRSTKDFDGNPNLFNVKNGTIDLTTGKLKPHDRADLITKIAPVEYDPKADCPTWLKFLHQVMGNDADLVSYLQRAIGYSLTGDTSEHCFFLLFGTGSNGKSTFVETIRNLLGDYAQAASFDTFLERRSEGPRNDIAKLVGTRFVAAAEPDVGKNLSESIVKQLTGGDMIEARALYKEGFNFKPTFKIFLAANHKPGIRGQDIGIWRRVKLIPFSVTIADEKRDRRLPEKLKAELPGILNWALAGCLDWQKNGLGEPDEVREATASYREETDRLRDFIAECCSAGGHDAAAKQVELVKLFKVYTSYCEETSEHPLTKPRFMQAITERGFLVKAGAGNKRFVYGIRLLERATVNQEPPEYPPDSEEGLF